MKNNILNKDILNLYDYVSLRNTTLDIFKLFEYLERTNLKIYIPKITADYRVRYEQFIPVRTSIIEECVLNKMMLEVKNTRQELLSKITIALRKLSDLELEVFDLVFYKNKNEEEIAQIISYGKDKAREIRKSACIKFLSALGLDKQCIKRGVNNKTSFLVRKNK